LRIILTLPNAGSYSASEIIDMEADPKRAGMLSIIAALLTPS